MRPWTVERGSLWALETAGEPPRLCSTRAAAEFVELGLADAADLAAAMNLPGPEPVRQRLQSGRRCFALRVTGQLAAYGWVTRGAERVGELERIFKLRDGEAYIWDCATLPAWRGQRLYSALLSQIARQLHRESAERIWIGAAQQNGPSLRGFANAGFEPVVNLTYRRIYRLTLMWLDQPPSSRRPLVVEAYRILIGDNERRLGRLVVGYKRAR